MRYRSLLSALGIAGCLLGSAAPRVGDAAPSFSLDLASPSVPGVSNSALLAPGPLGGPPVVLGAPGSMGLSGGATDEINAMTTGGILGTLHFSVDRGSVGSAGAVVAQAAAGQAAGDIYQTLIDGGNALALNQDSLGELPATSAGAASAPPIDDLDALDFKAPAPPILFALVPGHPYPGTAVGCGGDLFISGGAGGFFFSYLSLGLASCADAIDALHQDAIAGDFYYSLAPGSPSLAAGSPIAGCAAGCSPADLFRVSLATQTVQRFATASDLGLAASDNVDALAWSDAAPVPALGGAGRAALAAVLGIVALATLAAARRRRSRETARTGTARCQPLAPLLLATCIGAGSARAAMPLDVLDPTPRDVFVEQEISSDLGTVGESFGPPLAASYSTSGDTGTLVISIASHEAMRTGFLTPIPGTFTPIVIEIDLTSLEATSQSASGSLQNGPTLMAFVQAALSSVAPAGYVTGGDISSPVFCTSQQEVNDACLTVPAFCGATCNLVAGSGYDVATGEINLVGSEQQQGCDGGQCFGPFVLFSERGDLRLTEPEAPQVPGLGAAATLLLVSLLAASAGPLARKRFVGP